MPGRASARAASDSGVTSTRERQASGDRSNAACATPCEVRRSTDSLPSTSDQIESRTVRFCPHGCTAPPGLRSLWPQGRGGSSPLFRTTRLSRFALSLVAGHSTRPTLRIQARSWQATPGETNGVLPALSEACGRIEGSERSTSKGTLRAGTHLAGPSVELRLGKPPSRACAAEARRAEARRRTPSQHARQDVLVCSRCGQAGAVWRCC